MSKRELNYAVNVTLFLFGVAVLATGLVLFFEFHVGHGSRATEFAGLSKQWWRNMHRSAALVAFPGMLAHVWLHWTCIRGMLRGFARDAAAAIRHRLLHQGPLLVLSLIVPLTGFVAWMAFPHHIEAMRHTRHTWIDVHNIAGLALLIGLSVHIGHRWKKLWV